MHVGYYSKVAFFHSMCFTKVQSYAVSLIILPTPHPYLGRFSLTICCEIYICDNVNQWNFIMNSRRVILNESDRNAFMFHVMYKLFLDDINLSEISLLDL